MRFPLHSHVRLEPAVDRSCCRLCRSRSKLWRVHPGRTKRDAAGSSRSRSILSSASLLASSHLVPPSATFAISACSVRYISILRWCSRVLCEREDRRGEKAGDGHQAGPVVSADGSRQAVRSRHRPWNESSGPDDPCPSALALVRQRAHLSQAPRQRRV